MIAEVIKSFRVLSRPMRRQFWWPQRREITERPGVVLISLDDLKEWERRSLERLLAHYRLQPLSDRRLPLDQLDEHVEHEPSWVAAYRALVLVSRTFLNLWALLSRRTSLAEHLCESDDLARLQIRILNGKCFSHISTLKTNRLKTVKRLRSFLRGVEHRRYEIWIVARKQKLAFIPAALPLPTEPLRVSEVVEMARRRPNFEPDVQIQKKTPKPAGTIRIMSYNVHSAIGLDGRLSLRRIAEVLHQYEPDFVALQELDAGCGRTGAKHQLDELKKMWPSEGEFFPLVRMRGGRYGIGYLSRLPVLDSTNQLLPPAEQRLRQEARGVQKITVSLPDGTEIDIFNTHLGLTRRERQAQLKAILKHGITEGRPQVLTGDFNCTPSSREYRMILRSWRPTQDSPARTWFGTFPIRHLDYCFCRGPLQVRQTLVPRDTLTRLASDHLPLITDLQSDR